MWDCASGGKSYAEVRVYIPPEYLGLAKSWRFAYSTFCSGACPDGEPGTHTGTYDFTNMLPAISATPVLQTNSYYNLNYTLNRSIAKAGTATLTSTIGGTPTQTVAAGSTGTFTFTTDFTYTTYCLDSEYADHTVDLKINWVHATSGYTYTTQKTGIAINHIRHPSSLTATNNNNGTVSLAWTASSSAENASITSGWQLQYQVAGGSWTTISTTIAKDNRSYNWTVPTLEQGTKTYDFRIHRTCFDINNGRNRRASLSINTNYETVTPLNQNGAFVLHTDGKIYFKTIAGIRPASGYSFEISGRQITNNAAVTVSAAEEVPSNHALAAEGYKWRFIPTGMQTCTPTEFSVQAKVGSTLKGAQVKQTLVWQPEIIRKLVPNTYRASKGFYNDRVELHWEVDENAADFTRFFINRYLLSDPSNTPYKVYNESYNKTGGKYTLFHPDGSAAAGSFYRYELFGVSTCDMEADTLSLGTELGFAQAFGQVQGQVLFENSTTGVPNVDIICTNTDAQDDLGKNRAIDFGNQQQEGYLTFPTPWVQQSSAQTIQMWLKLDSEKPAGQGHQLFYGCVPQYRTDSIFKQETGTLLNCNFETAAERAAWTIDNGSQTNKWVISNQAATSGDITGYKLYVSNDNGVSNAYTFTTNSIVVASRTVTSTGADSYTLEFDFRCKGETYFDYVKVFLVDAADNTIVSGASGPAAYNYSTNVVTVNPLNPAYPSILNGSNGSAYTDIVQHITATLTAEQMGVAGTEKKLVFMWKNDNNTGTQPPAAIDNVKIMYVATVLDHTETIELEPVPQVDIWLDENRHLGFELFGDEPNQQILNDTVFPLNRYFHYTGVLTSYNGVYALANYLDGKAVGNLQISNPQALTYTLGRISDNETAWKIDGKADEIRLWNRALTAQEIASDYNRYISSNANGLRGHYRFDEPDGAANALFDLSQNSQTQQYNENHGTLAGVATRTDTDAPAPELLALKARTNADGSYNTGMILPYGNATTYSITPMLGVHQFSPAFTNVTVSASQPTFSQINFTDNSKFTYNGKVCYTGGNFPVEGCTFSINSGSGYVVQTDSEGQPVKTNAAGEFSLIVPVGNNTIRVEKAGHVFEKDTIRRNFQDDELSNSVVRFWDKTRVRIVGRIVGGTVESGKPLGFGESANNIGRAQLDFVPLKEQYTFFTNNDVFPPQPIDSTETFVHWNTERNNTVRYSNDGGELGNLTHFVVTTNSATGEFYADVIPEQFTVKHIYVGQGATREDYLQDGGVAIDLRNTVTIDPSVQRYLTRETTDAAGEVTHIDSIPYNYQYEYTHRVTPNMLVTQDGGTFESLTYFGDKFLIDKDDYSEQVDTVPMLSVDNGQLYYLFGRDTQHPNGCPVFSQGGVYPMTVNLRESYTNWESGVQNNVPVTGEKITVRNYMSANSEAQSLYTDSVGNVHYEATVSQPEITTGMRSIQFDYDCSGVSCPNFTMPTIVLGGTLTGSNFMTKGPDKVFFVLRDPPGSNSYAYREAGASSTEKAGYSLEQSAFAGATGSIETGTAVTTITVAGAPTTMSGMSMTMENKNTQSVGLFIQEKVNAEHTVDVTATLTQRVETGSAPEWVGADADVFVGSSTNIIYGESNNLAVARAGGADSRFDNVLFTSPSINGKQYKIGLLNGINVSKSFATSFFYTQREIQQTMIPEWYDYRADLLEQVTPAQAQAKANNTGKPVYRSLVDSNDDNYGVTDEGYEIIYPASWNNTNFVDTVAMCNLQISTWEKYLELNEKSKVEAKDDTHKFNYSFTSGVSLDYSIKKDSIDDRTVLAGAGFKEEGDFNTGVISSLLGGISVNIHEEIEFIDQRRTGSTTTAEQTYGFVLSDQDAENKLTLDIIGAQPGSLEDIDRSNIMGAGATVKANGVPGGFIFLTQGGQTSCPYEGEQATQYYNPGTILNEATMRNEVPELLPVGTTTRTGVPANAQAFYTVDLVNNSESGVDTWYDLRVAGGSNPLGATVKMDGAVLTENGQPVFVAAGSTVRKTVSIERGNGYEFDNIKLVLASQCQYNYLDDVEDIFSAIELTAHFQTGCSDIHLAQPLNQWTLNTNDTVGIINIKVDNFDANLSSLGWVDLQYKASHSSAWTTLKRYYMSQDYLTRDGSMSADSKALYDNAGYIAYNWHLGDPAMFDGNYDIRAIASCVNPQNLAINYQTPSTVSTGIKDMLRPEIFGRPHPRDGVLDIEDEITIQFNEAIAASMLLKGSANSIGNLYVQGIKNEGQGPKYHPASIHFDGTATATTASDVILQTPFSVEAWIRPNINYNDGVDHIIFSHADQFKIGIVENKLFVENNGSRIYSTDIGFTNGTPEWGHLAVSYGANGIVYGYYALGTANNTFNGNIGAYNRTGRIAIGNSVAGNTGVNADIHDLRVWNTARSTEKIAQNLTTGYLGVEPDLKHYWRMDEAQGATATDLKGGLTATLGSATWTFGNTGAALSLTSGSNLEIPAGQLAFSQNQDFAIEMWFKGGMQANATLFSAGNGDGTDRYADHTANSSQKLSIGFNSSSKLAVVSNGNTYASTANYLDSTWHHIVFTVNRLSNASLYVDGNQVINVSASNIGGLQGDNSSFYLGQRVWFNNTSDTISDRPFTGKIDNFRIWNAALDASFINDNKNLRANEKQPALVANYPFESYTLVDGSPVVKDSLINFVDARIEKIVVGSGTGYNPLDFAQLNGGATLVANDYAPLKMEGPNQDLGFNYVASGDKIIITMTEPRNRIEGALLTFIADGIQDLNGNKQKSSVVWTALVNQTQLRWSQKDLALETQPGSVITKTVQISNSGGESETYTITGIPTWLQVTPSSGTVDALGSQTITLQSVAATNIGKYATTLLLNGKSVDQMNVSLNVKTPAPDWSVNPAGYEQNANLTAALLIDGAYSTDTDDKLAAFVGNECRGVANLTHDSQRGRYSVYLTLYSDNFANDNFIFRIWDASRSEIREADTDADINLASGYAIGSVTMPIVFYATDAELNEIPLAAGWSWISINIKNDDMSVNKLFGEVTDKMVQLKNKTNFSAPYQGEILGEIDLISNTQMYKIRMNGASVLHTAGTPVAPATTPITLNPGWNWIAYTPQGMLNIQEALAGLQANTNDVIKSQTAFATYSNGLWQGSLTTMEPGKGYVYQRVGTTARTFTYPYVAPQGVPAMRAATANEATIFTPKNAGLYENNMSIIAVVKSGNDTLKNVEVGAFVGDECRGAVRSKESGLLFLTVAGNEGGVITFKVYNHATGQYLATTQTLPYETDMLQGSIAAPYILQGTSTGIDNVDANSISIYPNPVKNLLYVTNSEQLTMNNDAVITDLLGRTIGIFQLSITNSIDVSSLPAGIYLLKIGNYTGRFIKE